jgi:GntR family transcriptional regulator, transcriptional repressor for pyruvate dehydrogenase complex
MSRELLTEHLRDGIVSGRLAPGAKLPPERALAQEFRLSRPIVREVLSGLQERGLIEILPARGTFVRAPSAAAGARSLESHYRRRNATAREVMDARLMLETHAARLAAAHATPEEVEALARCVADKEAAETVVERARHDITFHGLLARASHNTVIETMFASITGLTFELMLRSQADPRVAREGMPYHRIVLDAVRRGDPDAAEAGMRKHLELAASLYGGDYDRSVESVARRELERALGPSASLDALLDEVTRRVDAARAA